MRLRGKVAIVTGGGSGIGRAIAERFGREGAAVVVNGRRPGPIAEVADAIRKAGGRAQAAVADVTAADECETLVQAALEGFGRLDVLVNNAGGIVARAPAGETRDEAWEWTLEANLTSAFRCSRAALGPLAIARGAIVNVASVAGAKGTPGNAAYAAAKAGMINLTKSMALDYAARGIRVNAICPGFIETDFNRDHLAALRRTGEFDALVVKHPLGLGQPEDIAWAAVYLASDEARWVTGVALPVDGGMLAGL
ncbi:MAG TPA: glucose 1-dehydrogenase [Candidatus Tectomicrobia bacterium]|nr:glucose 1-dehydrogenase [Candidatus Tectomicrobia bacterium]